MKVSILPIIGFLFVTSISAQQVEMFPYGPYVSHCRAADVLILNGGDDDHNNVYYFAVDTSLADGIKGTYDFYIHLWDGDNNPVTPATGTQDCDIEPGVPGNSIFEYRLYGGPGASHNNEAIPGEDPLLTDWTGILIDIDSDLDDDTLNTADNDDIDGDDPEDLRDQDFSIIGVDMDSDPGDLVGTEYIYKFVVDGRYYYKEDGSIGNCVGTHWNRYEIQATRDEDRNDITGVKIHVYELTFAGRPSFHSQWTNLSFFVPPGWDLLDIQTLDLDRTLPGIGWVDSTVTTPLTFYGYEETYESDEQYVGGAWMWTSLNQPESLYPNGNGVTGSCYNTVGEEGMWTLDVNAGTHPNFNPFSVKFNDENGDWLQMLFDPIFLKYGSGPIDFSGTGLPQSGGAGEFTLEALNAPPNTAGVLLVSLDSYEYISPKGWALYVSLPMLIGAPITIGFDKSGSFSGSFDVPAGITADTYLFLQVFADDKPLKHSNGLRMRIVAE